MCCSRTKKRTRIASASVTACMLHTVTDMHMVTEKSDMHHGGALTLM